MFEMSAALRELYAAGLRPEDVVMPCECGGCGTMPARVTNVAGDVRRRCLSATYGTRIYTTTTGVTEARGGAGLSPAPNQTT